MSIITVTFYNETQPVLNDASAKYDDANEIFLIIYRTIAIIFITFVYNVIFYIF